MSNLILCKGQYAKTPYYILNSGIHVYCLEELAYYICNNVYSVDENLLDKSLCSWISDELQLSELGKELSDSIGGFNTLSSFVGKILLASGLCSDTEINQIKSILDDIGNKNEFFRRKHKADTCLADNKLKKAVFEYQRLLRYRGLNKESDEAVGNVWNNLGVAFSKQFIFDKAAECFSKAYTLNKSRISYQQYLICLYFLKENGQMQIYNDVNIQADELDAIKIDIDNCLFEHKSNHEHRLIELIERNRETGNISGYHDGFERILSNWKSECRESIE